MWILTHTHSIAWSQIGTTTFFLRATRGRQIARNGTETTRVLFCSCFRTSLSLARALALSQMLKITAISVSAFALRAPIGPNLALFTCLHMLILSFSSNVTIFFSFVKY